MYPVAPTHVNGLGRLPKRKRLGKVPKVKVLNVEDSLHGRWVGGIGAEKAGTRGQKEG